MKKLNFDKTLSKVCQNARYLRPAFPCIRTEPKIMSLYGNTRSRENAHSGIFWAVTFFTQEIANLSKMRALKKYVVYIQSQGNKKKDKRQNYDSPFDSPMCSQKYLDVTTYYIHSPERVKVKYFLKN